MNPSSSTQALLIFIKNATLGKVKTRLAQTVGDQRALKIYKALLQHTKAIALTTPATRLLFYSENINENDDWSSDDFQKLLQQDGDLGVRMQAAFATAFQEHEKVIIIGSDCASLNPEIVQTAFEQLDHFPFVIGPAFDGGYYLLGMNTYQPSLFEDIAWSTDTVLPATIAKIEALQQNYYCLPTLSDIDYEEDWKKYGWEIE
ncbi:MAG: TIGR04282 family arsenosugar biosynthesis glycosyltransferase [Saprospiraceae bacterium]